MKYLQIPLVILATLSASLAVADDFKTSNGKEYKNATVTRVEPDGIMVKTKSGLSKLYFTELPKEVQERFHYDPVKAGQFAVGVQAAVAQSNTNAQQEAATKEKAEKAQREAQARQATQPQWGGGYRVGPMQSVGGGGNLPP